MTDIEIPTGKRKRAYRFFEMLPAIASYGAIILLIVLSLIIPLLAAAYLLLIIITTLIKSVGIAVHTTMGRNNLEHAMKIDWHKRLLQLEEPELTLIQ